jgi:hypothetical protein
MFQYPYEKSNNPVSLYDEILVSLFADRLVSGEIVLDTEGDVIHIRTQDELTPTEQILLSIIIENHVGTGD